MHRILAINPGSTSTKIAVYEDEKRVLDCSIDHSIEEVQSYKSINDQYEMRYEKIVDLLRENKLDISDLDCVVGRGGAVLPISSGAYEVTEELVERARSNPMVEHASNLGPIIAYEMSRENNIPAYIYDAVSTDEMSSIAKFSGLKGYDRRSLFHTLNMRASAIKVAKSLGKKYEEMNFIVAHLGGGLSLSVHKRGKMIDGVTDDEGSFSPERSGGLPSRTVMKLSYEKEKSEVARLLVGSGGLVSYLNTNDARDVEKKIAQGDLYAKEVYEAMSYQIAKGIGELATVVEGDVDRIILTGGMAYSKMMTESIIRKVAFIAEVEVVPGENELEALAMGGLRVLRGEEEAKRI